MNNLQRLIPIFAPAGFFLTGILVGSALHSNPAQCPPASVCPACEDCPDDPQQEAQAPAPAPIPNLYNVLLTYNKNGVSTAATCQALAPTADVAEKGCRDNYLKENPSKADALQSNIIKVDEDTLNAWGKLHLTCNDL